MIADKPVKLDSTPIREVEMRVPVRTELSQGLFDLVRSMKEPGRDAAVVEDDNGRISGVFTEWDLVQRVDLTNEDWHTRSVSEVMTVQVQTVPGHAPIAEVLSLMTDGKLRHVPIVDRDGYSIGIVSARDILAHIAGFFPEEFLNLPPDPDHEAKTPWGG